MKTSRIIFNAKRERQSHPDKLIALGQVNGSLVLTFQQKDGKPYVSQLMPISLLRNPSPINAPQEFSFVEWQQRQFSREVRRGFSEAADMIWQMYDRLSALLHPELLPRMRWNRQDYVWETYAP